MSAMIEEQAIVESIDKKGDAILKVQRGSGCSSCQLKAGCGTGSLSRLMGDRVQRVTIQNSHGVKPGDKILIGLEDNLYLTANFLIYLLPIISLFLFAIISDFIYESTDWINAVFALLGVIVGLILAVAISRHFLKEQFQAKFIRQLL